MKAEEQTIDELNAIAKPYVILLNSQKPYSDETRELASGLKEKYQTAVLPVNCEQLRKDDIVRILENILCEFPVTRVEFFIPKWTEMLKPEHPMKAEIIKTATGILDSMHKTGDVRALTFTPEQYVSQIKIDETDLATGRVTVRMDDWPSEARVESELFDVLPGTWTISYSYLDYNDMPQEIKDVEVKIEAGVDDKTCKEYRARNMLVLTGYPFQGGEPLYYSPADLMRESSWYSAAPELAYRDYGAKIFFHIGEGDEVTVPSSKSVYLYNWGDWPLLFVGMDYDKYQLAPASFPVEVSSDRRTLTIKQYVSGAEFEYGVYRPSVVMDGVKLNVAVSDIVLRKVD